MRIGATLLLLALVLAPANDVWLEREAPLMGTTLRARVSARDARQGQAALTAAFAQVERVDRLLSNWRDDSDLSRFNRSPAGTATTLPPELYAIVVEARGWYEATGGAFDPGTGALTDAWDLRGAGRHPAPDALERARAASGITRFGFNDAHRSLRRPEGGWYDSGAFGKGLALRYANRALREAGVVSAHLDLGGQVLAVGTGADGRPWEFRIPHPSRRSTPVATLSLTDRSASVTSQSARFVTLFGARFGHVLDPRTGQPVPPWGSVTVVAADPALADVLSTALFVMGPDSGMAWLGNRSDVGALFLIERQGRLEVRMNAAMRPWVMRLPESGS